MQEFDFNKMENSTEYDGGFSRDTPCVRWLIMTMCMGSGINILYPHWWEVP